MILANRLRIRHKQDAGQSMVEVAMFLPLLILIVIVLIDFGIVFASYLSLVNAAREGAVFSAMYPQLADPSCGSIPHEALYSITGTACIGYQDDKAYGGGGGITNTVKIWDEYVDRIKNDSFVPVAETLEAAQLVDQDLLYIDRPILGPTSSVCPTRRDAGCYITVTVRYRIHTFTSDISLPIYGRFGLPSYYQINYTVGMPIR